MLLHATGSAETFAAELLRKTEQTIHKCIRRRNSSTSKWVCLLQDNSSKIYLEVKVRMCLCTLETLSSEGRLFPILFILFS